MKERRLLTIGHSYVVTENRRLAHEIAVQARGGWDVVAIAPRRFHGDLGPIEARAGEGEAVELRTVPVRFGRSAHFMRYAALREAMGGTWDLVHAWEEPYVAAGAQIAAAAPPSARLVYSTFQNIAKAYPWPLSSFERQSMSRADGWIAFGELVHATLRSRDGYAGKPSRVITPGVDTRRFRPDAAAGAQTRRELGWPESARVVGFLGRFEPQKGLDLLCRAVEALAIPWQALFVGGGSLEPALRAFADRHPSRVRVVTGVKHGDVPRWLNAMTLLCAPSQTTTSWKEQFGRMLVEAMSCGVPVVGSDSGEIPYVIADAGTVLPEGDAEAWTAAIASLLDDPLECRRRAEKGLSRAREQFAWPAIARAHLAWFEEVLA
ncbi:MAG TPA: glycosyltransferase family 4 protein [Vicinamibacterales bacterium]|nr:glycosyltransferase family 4 protein [Vicinamibacterales bacterium]